MKRLTATFLAAITIASSLASCSVSDSASSVTLASSDAKSYADWLSQKLGETPSDVVLGIGSDAKYGIDMTDFESDGYILRTVNGETVIFGKTADGLDLGVREYAKAAESDTIAQLDTVYHEGYRIERLTIAGRDISEYTVYIPESANENMKFAANELVRLVNKATGITIPVITGEATAPFITFTVSDDESLKNDGYRYTVTDSGILFECAEKRGAANAVWRFLQNECGWDCLIYGDSYLNESDHIDIPAGTDRSETPAFEFLNLYNPYNTFITDRATPIDAQNSYGTVTQACHGLQNHNFCKVDNFLKQICYTDEDMYQRCLEEVEKYVAANYGNPNFKEVDIAQFDTSEYCFCDTCEAMYKEEGGNAGAVVKFANRLQEELEKKYPGIVYKIFAYAGTNVPPKTAPNELVYVTFCYDMNCSNHKVDGTECKDSKDKVSMNKRTNEDYATWFEGWCDLTPNVYIWPYTLGTSLHSYTVLDNIYDDYRYYAENEVRGIFLESEDCGAFSVKRIEHQLIGELNWNIDMTREEFDALLCILLEKEYGDGWSYISEYIDQWNQAQDLAGCWQCWGWNIHGGIEPRYDTGFYSERFDSFVELFEAALSSANSTAQENAVNRLYASVLYTGCYSSYFPAYTANDTERIEVLNDRYEHCMNIVRSFGYDPTNMPTISGGDYSISYSTTLYEAAWNDWRGWYDDIMGHPLPEDAPEIAPAVQ